MRCPPRRGRPTSDGTAAGAARRGASAAFARASAVSALKPAVVGGSLAPCGGGRRCRCGGRGRRAGGGAWATPLTTPPTTPPSTPPSTPRSAPATSFAALSSRLWRSARSAAVRSRSAGVGAAGSAVRPWRRALVPPTAGADTGTLNAGACGRRRVSFALPGLLLHRRCRHARIRPRRRFGRRRGLGLPQGRQRRRRRRLAGRGRRQRVGPRRSRGRHRHASPERQRRDDREQKSGGGGPRPGRHPARHPPARLRVHPRPHARREGVEVARRRVGRALAEAQVHRRHLRGEGGALRARRDVRLDRGRFSGGQLAVEPGRQRSARARARARSRGTSLSPGGRARGTARASGRASRGRGRAGSSRCRGSARAPPRSPRRACPPPCAGRRRRAARPGASRRRRRGRARPPRRARLAEGGEVVRGGLVVALGQPVLARPRRADVVDREVRGDPADPRRERAARLEAVEGPPGAHERLLGHVVGHVVSAHDPQGHGVHAPLVPPHQLLESRGVALPRPGDDERLVGLGKRNARRPRAGTHHLRR